MAHRITNKAVLKLREKTADKDDAIRRRIALLYEGLSDAERASLDEHPLGVPSRLRLYVEAREELFGLYAFRSALDLFLGEGTSERLIKRMYEPDESA